MSRYPISNEHRATVIEALVRVLECGFDQRTEVSAARAILYAEKVNLDLDKFEFEKQKHAAEQPSEDGESQVIVMLPDNGRNDSTTPTRPANSVSE